MSYTHPVPGSSPGACTDMKEYLKYYWLEKYLEKQVRSHFETKGFLTAKQFFSIIEWKNAKFGKGKLAYLKDGEIKKLTGDIYKEADPKERLRILLEDDKEKRKGIKLATASAILTILYPKKFTIYDIRVRKQLYKYGKWIKVPQKKDRGKEDLLDITYHTDVVDEYFNDYLPAVKSLREEGMSLRDCDRALWAKDWHEDLEEWLSNRHK